ncbi:hypothetical protein JCM11641_002731 [Rhodosporidiobolus odoratus]
MNNSIIVHHYTPVGQSPPSDHDLRQQSAAAARLVVACLLPPARSHTSDPLAHGQQGTMQLTRASTACRQAVPPGSLAPGNLADTADETAVLPNAGHLASGLSHLPQTQGILRKRTTGVARAWADADSTQGRKKKVRVESPRSTGAAAEKTANPKVEKVSKKASNGAGGPRRAARVLVPATPSEDEPRERPELAFGAVQRCIPSPYAHTDTNPCSDPNPSRQHPAAIQHSFVDPAFSPPSSSSSALLSGTSQFSQLADASPETFAYLSPGRRGSWILPISGQLDIPRTSGVRWFTLPPAPSSARPSSSTLRGSLRPEEPPPSIPIDWTDARLKALWTLLDSLHASSGLGSLRATCHIPPLEAPLPITSRPASRTRPPLPTYVKIITDAHLALPLRGVLNQLTVQAMDAMSQEKSGERAAAANGGKATTDDREKWLRGRALVWVDEMGRAVFTA